ncbi:hypothetical protein ABHN84_12120 [Shewanella vesiculosa]|uniref:DUF3592 domain-containing protein n=1 Tax=Shewanella vesiculosa TaxID=518738 RepID=A0ABV0FQE4_9GAMM|tara:strand:+ start:22 stop:471 length:450 start_codon:yes stop_codon:yes gene_type:complete
MTKFWINHKIDIVILAVILLSISVWFFHVWSDENIEEIDLSNSAISCELNGKFSTYSVRFSKNGTDYFMTKKYNFCELYRDEIRGKSIKGEYLKGNHLLKKIEVDGASYHEQLALSAYFSGLLLASLCWVFIRTPIKWVALKMHNKTLN